MFIKGLIFSLVTQMIVYGAMLLLPAHHFHWWRAWVLLGFVLIANIVMMFTVFHGNEALLKERMKPPVQHGQPVSDKIVLFLFVGTYFFQIIFGPLDVFRFHFLGGPSFPISVTGLFLFAVGWAIISLSMKANTYATTVVKLQEERDHRLIDKGAYAVVRHPMYSGMLLLMVGMGLWLGSYADTLFAVIPITTIIIRIQIEENFLNKELEGYSDYTHRVRYRLIPRVW